MTDDENAGDDESAGDSETAEGQENTRSDENAGGGEGAATERAKRLQKVANGRDLDADALDSAHEDAQLTLEQTLQTFSDLSGKAFRLIRLNALVLTILVAVASQVPVGRYVNVPTVASILLFLWSSLSALVAYLTTTFNRGFDAATFENLVTYRLRKEEYLNWILTRAYPRWIADGAEKVNRKERWIRQSLIAFTAGITTLLVGILFTLY